MFKLALLSVVFAVAQAQVVLPAGYAGYGGLYGYNQGAYPAPIGYAHGAYAQGAYAPGAYAAAPIAHVAAYASPAIHAAPVAAIHAAPIAAVHAAPIAHQAYAVPAARVEEHAAIVQQFVEPVEQHGYRIRY